MTVAMGIPPRCFLRRRSFQGEPGVNPRRRFDAATRNHPHLACTSNPSTGRKLEPNRTVQKNAGKRAVFDLGAGARRTLQEDARRHRRLVSAQENGSVSVAHISAKTCCDVRETGEIVTADPAFV